VVSGVDVLRMNLEQTILAGTNRRKLKIRVPAGSDAIRWLYKNATVVAEVADTKDTQFVLAEVIITHAKLEKFKHDFAP
jgi:hypothetical protein